ncbi:MAG: hypothetical protein LBM96_09935 [Methanobrevibacter sp.]|jgi:hypothetical protein|nr:hypothetical protein [Candidatus Methanoflexus mossambicus]
MNNDTYSEIKEKLEKIKQDSILENVFWEEISKSKDDIWLYPLFKEGFLTSYNKMSYWRPSEYLEKLSIENEKNPNPEITKILKEIIEDYIKHNFGENRNGNIDHTFLKIIFSLPKDDMKMEYIDAVEAMLSNRDNILIQGEISENILKKAGSYELDCFLRLLEIVLKFKIENYGIESAYLDNLFEEVLKNNKEMIAKLCAFDAAKIGLKTISSAIKEDKYQFASISSITPHVQNIFEDNYDILLVFFIREMLEYEYSKNEKQKIADVVNVLLHENHVIFKKIGFHLINFAYDDLNEYFWNIGFNPLNVFGARHEIYELFKNNSIKFNDEQIKKIICWVDNSNYIKKITNEGVSEEVSAYQKLRWFQSLEKSENQEIKERLIECKKFHSEEIEYPDFGVIHTKLETIIPKYEKSFCDKKVEKIIECLDEMKEKDEFELMGSFRICVSKNPLKFIEKLNYFVESSEKIQYELILGLSEAKKVELDGDNLAIGLSSFKKILEFVNTILIQKLVDKTLDSENYLINMIPLLISEFIPDDEEDFNNISSDLKKVILLLLNVSKDNEKIDEKNLSFNILNSTSGRIYDLLFVYIYNEYYKSNREIDKEIKKVIEKEINKQSTSFLYNIGLYFIYLCRADKTWVKNNIDLIFSETCGKYSFLGYLRNPHVHKDIYHLLKKKSYYKKALKENFHDVKFTSRLIEHICLFDLKDMEIDDEKSLINFLIHNKKPEQISILSNTVYRMNIPENLAKQLWIKIYESLLDGEDEEFCKIMAATIHFMKYITKLDDDYTNLIVNISKCDLSKVNIYKIIKMLEKHANESAQNVGRIFGVLSEKTPLRPKDSIDVIMKALNLHCDVNLVNRICNDYINKGHIQFKKYLK